MKTLLRGLHPAYLRLGGTRANFIIFKDNEESDDDDDESEFYRPMTREELEEWKKKKAEKLKNYKNFTMTRHDLDNVYQLAADAKLKLIFDFNAFLRDANNVWDPTNAVKILDYAAERNYSITWQLGNEPNSYGKFGKHRKLTGTQLGMDYKRLKKILNSNPKYGRPKLIGPESVRPRGKDKEEKFISDFLIEAKDAISALTWHQYYIDGKLATPEDFIDPDVLEEFRIQNEKIDRAAQTGGYSGSVWLTETGSAWGGGADGASNRYVAGFPFLDKLGIAAKYCRKVVVRQSFFGAQYAMVDYRENYEPFPDYYTALIYKRLVGREVLSLSGGDRSFRVYAHCANRNRLPAGAVTVTAINTKRSPITFSLEGLEKHKTSAYILTASALDSVQMSLNGKVLALGKRDRLPHIIGQDVNGENLEIPGLSYGFFVIEDANNNVCKSTEA